MREVVITDAIRTAVGVLNGALRDVDEQTLSAAVIKGLMNRANVAPHDVDEVIMGSVRMNTRPMDVARFSLLQSGMPEKIPGYTLHRACSSGSQAISDASMIIGCGDAEVVIAGGVENMSMSPYFLRHARGGVGNNDAVFFDGLTESGRSNTPDEIYGTITMGITAENVADQYQIPREIQDNFAFVSQQRTHRAVAEGRFKEQILPINGFDTDEGPRDVTIEQLKKLKPVFRKDGSVTAGNSCGRNDGASVVLVMSREKAEALGKSYYLKYITSAVAGVSPRIMGIGPIDATRKALKKAGLSLNQIGMIELNEAFSSQSVAVLREWASWDKSDDYEKIHSRTNINGGAIALGHPMGATGSILTTKLFYALQNRPDVRYALVTMCIGGGMGFAAIFERCGQVIV